jgi:hypothetical protein
LVVEQAPRERSSLEALVSAHGMQVEGQASAEEAFEALQRQRFDALVLDPALPGQSGFDLLDRAREAGLLEGLPVIIYSTRRLTAHEKQRLARDAVEIVPKSSRAATRLAEALERVLRPGYLAETPAHGRGRLLTEAGPDPLTGRQILVVDDDVRNIFALTSVLESHGMTVLYAENGPDGIRTLQAHPEVDLVLMDIMMPEMDGYETTQAIRQLPAFSGLPIIALTAKAMKGDREKCLAAGASDYVAKPVDAEKLLAVMRRWVGQARPERSPA